MNVVEIAIQSLSLSELIIEIARTSAKIEADYMRLAKPLSEQDIENSRYWLDKRSKTLKLLCAELVRREESKGLI